MLIGDGTSDRKAALLADVVFAKGALARWCALSAVPHRTFETLADVHAVGAVEVAQQQAARGHGDLEVVAADGRV